MRITVRNAIRVSLHAVTPPRISGNLEGLDWTAAITNMSEFARWVINNLSGFGMACEVSPERRYSLHQPLSRPQFPSLERT